MTAHTNDTSLSSLRDQVTGQVLTPDHPDYDAKRLVWNLTIEHHPAVIVIAQTVQDVAAAVRFAHEAGLTIAVQSTGHGQKYNADDNLLLITSELSSVEVDPKTRTAHVGAGVRWQSVIDAATLHGLAPLLGSAPHVGVVGYTLGGGIGWLSRQYGFAADSLREVEIVTGDGELRHASPTENSELFWGLRGGGGNFGVVTALTFELYPVATIYGGSLTYPGDNVAETLRFFRDWTQNAPQSLSAWIKVLKFPALPQLPEAIRGKIQIILEAVYLGTAAEGTRLMQPWLDWRQPIANTLHEMPFAEIGTVNNDPTKPTAGLFSNELFNELSDSAIDIIVQYATNPTSPLFVHELRHTGGAISHIDAETTAIGHRETQYYLQMGTPRIQGDNFTPEDHAVIDPYMQEYKTALHPVTNGGVYLSFVDGEEAGERLQDAFSSETRTRLLELKRHYDPTNIFCFSFPLNDA
jgi:FAD/FMN-containing dehydrogenase